MLAVAIASSDLTSSAHLLAALEQTGLVHDVKQWTIPVDRLPEAGEEMPDVIFLDLNRDPEPFLQFAAHLRRGWPTLKLVACSNSVPPSPQLLLEAMRSGIQDFIPKPVDAASLRKLLHRVESDSQPIAAPSANKLIVIMGAKGGVGTTTVAVNLGVQLCSFANKRTILLDFARPLGNAHLLLDLNLRFGLRDSVENLDRLDSHFLAGLLTAHKTKLEILGGVTQPEEWQTINVNVLDRIVNVAKNSFDYVLADVGSQFSSEWSSIFRLARKVLIVAEANVPARWHKTDDEVLRSIEKQIEQPVFASFPNDYRKASQAFNLGTPIPDNHNNLLNDRYRYVAAQLAGMSVLSPERKRPLANLFPFVTKR